MMTFLCTLCLIVMLIAFFSGIVIFASFAFWAAKLFLIGAALYAGYSFARWLLR